METVSLDDAFDSRAVVAADRRRTDRWSGSQSSSERPSDTATPTPMSCFSSGEPIIEFREK